MLPCGCHDEMKSCFAHQEDSVRLICYACPGELQIPQETLYKKNVLLMRGRFRPFTLLHNDMLQGESWPTNHNPVSHDASITQVSALLTKFGPRVATHLGNCRPSGTFSCHHSWYIKAWNRGPLQIMLAAMGEEECHMQV